MTPLLMEHADSRKPEITMKVKTTSWCVERASHKEGVVILNLLSRDCNQDETLFTNTKFKRSAVVGATGAGRCVCSSCSGSEFNRFSMNALQTDCLTVNHIFHLQHCYFTRGPSAGVKQLFFLTHTFFRLNPVCLLRQDLQIVQWTDSKCCFNSINFSLIKDFLVFWINNKKISE